MLLTFEDDGCVHLYRSLAEIVSQIEALDAENTLREVFDDDGQRYVIDWIRPNTRWWILVGNGEYRLVARGLPDPKGLLRSLDHAEKCALTEGDMALVESLKRKLASTP